MAGGWSKPRARDPRQATRYAVTRAPLDNRQREGLALRYLHTMLRVRNLDDALDFYCNKLGMKEVRRRVDEKNKYTLVFLAAGPAIIEQYDLFPAVLTLE